MDGYAASLSRSLNASRTGMRLKPNREASSSCRSATPPRSSPPEIASRRILAMRSATVSGRMASTFTAAKSSMPDLYDPQVLPYLNPTTQGYTLQVNPMNMFRTGRML
ncbi:hypothetical protein AGR4B_pAt20088 [Agrobacterium tumefaciens str. CFBP 5621]|nr:hypothetical protein AGR4B_pAt20088 [Agrobacterium tumefaciens str. CFBP 5621]